MGSLVKIDIFEKWHLFGRQEWCELASTIKIDRFPFMEYH